MGGLWVCVRFSPAYTEHHHPATPQIQASTPPLRGLSPYYRQTRVAVDGAEVLAPGCSSLNPGPESRARIMGRMLVSPEQGCTKDVS